MDKCAACRSQGNASLQGYFSLLFPFKLQQCMSPDKAINTQMLWIPHRNNPANQTDVLKFISAPNQKK